MPQSVTEALVRTCTTSNGIEWLTHEQAERVLHGPLTLESAWAEFWAPPSECDASHVDIRHAKEHNQTMLTHHTAIVTCMSASPTYLSAHSTDRIRALVHRRCAEILRTDTRARVTVYYDRTDGVAAETGTATFDADYQDVRIAWDTWSV